MLSSYLKPTDMLQLSKLATAHRYKKGTAIIDPEKPTDQVFIISEGLVTLYRTTSDAAGFVHIMYGPGEFFPIAGMSGQMLEGIRVVAESPVKVLQLPYAVFMDFARANPQRLEAVLRQVVEQFGLYTYRVENLQFRFASERSAYRLLLLASRFGEWRNGHLELVRISRSAIARAINLSEEATSREMSRLKQLGIIGYEPNKIIILDTHKLRAQLGKDVQLPFLALPSNRLDISK